MPAIMLTGYSQMFQAWAQEPPPKKRESDTTSHGNGQQAVDILLGVILGVAVFFVLTMVYVTFSIHSNMSRMIDLNHEGSFSIATGEVAGLPKILMEKYR
jgi:hypothetical protein